MATVRFFSGPDTINQEDIKALAQGKLTWSEFRSRVDPMSRAATPICYLRNGSKKAIRGYCWAAQQIIKAAVNKGWDIGFIQMETSWGSEWKRPIRSLDEEDYMMQNLEKALAFLAQS